MATPKKKVSKSRRNMRRFSSAYKLEPITIVTSPLNGEMVRTHRVTVETAEAYLAARKDRKEKRKSAARA